MNSPLFRNIQAYTPEKHYRVASGFINCQLKSSAFKKKKKKTQNLCFRKQSRLLKSTLRSRVASNHILFYHSAYGLEQINVSDFNPLSCKMRTTIVFHYRTVVRIKPVTICKGLVSGYLPSSVHCYWK